MRIDKAAGVIYLPRQLLTDSDNFRCSFIVSLSQLAGLRINLCDNNAQAHRETEQADNHEDFWKGMLLSLTQSTMRTMKKTKKNVNGG